MADIPHTPMPTPTRRIYARIRSRLTEIKNIILPDPYAPTLMTDTTIPPEMQDELKAQAKFSPMDRWALVMDHYILAMWGVRLRLFRPDKHHREPEKLLAWFVYGVWIVGMLVGMDKAPLVALGMAFLLTCPQWLYAFTQIQHTIFEYRGYLFAAGIACVIADLANASPWGIVIASCGVVFFTIQSRRRITLYTDPLLFWKQAHLDVKSDPLLASAYIYQLQKRERFGEVDDLYRWMTAARIPDCRSFLLNLAAAKFGAKNDTAPLDPEKIKQAEQILDETTRRWPGHEDVWRNLGTVRYYMATLGLSGVEGLPYSMDRAMDCFVKALEIRPNDVLSHTGAGYCLMYEGDWATAVEALTNAYNYLPAGAYVVEDISLVRLKLMEALDNAARTADNAEDQQKFKKEFDRHQKALYEYHAWYVTEENARYLV